MNFVNYVIYATERDEVVEEYYATRSVYKCNNLAFPFRINNPHINLNAFRQNLKWYETGDDNVLTIASGKIWVTNTLPWINEKNTTGPGSYLLAGGMPPHLFAGNGIGIKGFHFCAGIARDGAAGQCGHDDEFHLRPAQGK